MIIAFVLQGGYMVQSSPTSFFSFFFPDSLLYFLKVLVYILLQALRFSLIAENNYSHVLVVLFQKSSTTQYILLPSIFDMPGLYSISSLIRMTDKCGSTNFRLRGGGGGGARQNVTENGLVSFLVLNLPTVGSMSISKRIVLFGFKGGLG